jgi:hypothetical protein
LNRYKTSIFFSNNTKPEAKAHIIGVVRVNANQQYEKYLGLSALLGRSRISSFSGLQGEILNRINGRKDKFFSQARKEKVMKGSIYIQRDELVWLVGAVEEVMDDRCQILFIRPPFTYVC